MLIVLIIRVYLKENKWEILISKINSFAFGVKGETPYATLTLMKSKS